MSHTIKLLFIWILLVTGLILMGSCNPVKRVLNNQKKFEIVAKEVVKRGYCINDTIIIDTSRVDTIVKENTIIDSILIKEAIDTTLPSGTKVTFKNGILSVKCPPSKEITRVVKETQYIRDLKLESILKEELNTKSDSIEYLKFTLKDLNTTIKNKNAEIAKEKAKFIVLILVIGIFFAFYVYSKLKVF